MASVSASTREKLLAIALEEFAARGFEGVSIASIAQRLNLSKQALLHHFSSKEKLYAELLATISRDFETQLKLHEQDKGDLDALVTLLLEIAVDSRRQLPQTRLLMRELLDNAERSRNAGHWYLRPFLDALVERVRALPPWETCTQAAALTVVYQVLGAINYFAVSRDTLAAMFGDSVYGQTEAVFDSQLATLIHATLAQGPADQTNAPDT